MCGKRLGVEGLDGLEAEVHQLAPETPALLRDDVAHLAEEGVGAGGQDDGEAVGAALGKVCGGDVANIAEVFHGAPDAQGGFLRDAAAAVHDPIGCRIAHAGVAGHVGQGRHSPCHYCPPSPQ